MACDCGSTDVSHKIATNSFGTLCIMGAHVTFDFICKACGKQWTASDRQEINWQIKKMKIPHSKLTLKQLTKLQQAYLDGKELEIHVVVPDENWSAAGKQWEAVREALNDKVERPR